MEYKSNILENLQPDYIQLGSNVYADKLTGNVSIGEVQSATFSDKFMVKSTDGGANQIVLQHSGNGVAIAGIGQESSHGSLQLRLNSGATQVRLSAIEKNYILPSLGIGVTNFSAKLQVDKDNANSSVVISRSGSNLSTSTGVGSITFSSHYNSAYTDYAGIQAYSNNLSAVRGSLDFKVKSTSGTLLTGMTLYGTSSGINVGIGTDTPGVKLTVVTPNVVNTAVNVLKLGDDTNGLVFKSYFDASGIAWRLNKGLAGINMVTLSQGGNVGIDNLVPLQKLSVGGVINSDVDNDYYGAWLSGNSTAGAESYLGLGPWYNQAGYVKYYDNNRLSIYTYDTAEKLTLQESGGNVGIGMTGPNAKLQVDDGAIKIRNIVSSSPYSEVRRNINIASYDAGGTTSTGKLIIETPVMTTGAMATFKISGWQYDESWDLTVSGYLRFGTGRGWEQIGGAILTGNPPFDIDEVRLCYNDTTNIYYIILGDASTFWDYYASIVINADSYYQDSIPTTGWDMSVDTADPTGLSNIVTLTNIAEYGSSNAIIPGSLAIGSYSNNGRLNVTDGDAEMIFSAASSARPWLRLKHNVAPADGEEVGLLDFNGFNDADEDTRYALWSAKAEDVSDGTEDGSLTLMTQKAGILTNTLTGRSGKVGIANNNPAQALDVTGKIRVTDDLIMAQQNGRIDYDNGVATGALRFFSTSGNTERMRLSSSGDVLIGDTSRLNAYSAAFTTLSLVSRKDGDDASILELRGARSQNNGNQNSMIQFWNETSTATEVGRISSLQGGDVDDGQITFMTAEGGSLGERMRIGPDGIIKFNDYNAGNNIGTPTYLLGTDASGNVVKTNTGNTPIGSNIYTMPSTAGASAWKLLGRFTANNGGQSVFIKMVTNAGYNASIDQNSEVYIRFKTSNGGSLNANGFSGDSSFYTIGAYSGYPGGNIKWVSNAAGTAATSYELYINMPSYSGNGGFYSVENTVGTWTPLNNAATDPGAASSTILLPTKQFKVGGSDLVVGAGGADSYFANSNVGIGMTSPGTYKLNVAGTMRVGASAGAAWLAFLNNTSVSGHGLLIQAGGTTGTRYITQWKDYAGTERFHMEDNGEAYFQGNVGIGDSTPSYKLDVAGTIRATGDVIAYSDARVKDNVETIENALNKVTQLRGVSYTRNDVEDKTTKIGVIAQEVLEVLPEVVQQDDEGKYSVAYGNMVGLLIESIKELKAEVDELKSRL